MTPTSDLGQVDPAGDGTPLDPRTAARLLAETTRSAERQLDFRSPRLSFIAAVAVLIGFGSVWLSVRHQRPYNGPTALGLTGLYVCIAVRLATVAVAARRAGAGVIGASVRRHRTEALALGAVLVATYVLMAGLAHAGASHGVAYSVYGVTGTLLVLGVFWAGHSAARDDHPQLALAGALLAVAAGSAFAGPRGVWLSDGIGLCVVLGAYGALQAWVRRADAGASTGIGPA